MSRRVVFLIAFLSLVVLGTAAAPWTLTGGGLSHALAEHMKDRYGLDLTVEGRSTFAVLPIPRVKFENVTLRFPHEALKAEGGTLRGELRLLPLVFGRVELSDFDLSESRITGSFHTLRSLKWDQILKNQHEATHARRLIVNNSSIRWTDLNDANLDQVSLVIRWADLDGPMSIAGSALWHDETVAIEQASIYPDLLASNRLSPLSLTLSAPSGRLTVTGKAQLGTDPRITGEGTIQANSVRSFTRWSGVGLPFGSLIEALSITGDFSMDRRRLSWPSVAVTLGADKLEGTMAVRFEAERPLITGTLAAENLNLSDLFAPFGQARTSSGPWSEEVIDLTRVTGSDLDLRLSAATARLGRLQVDDMAASVLVRPGRVEASIGRADFHEGTLKGRLSLTTLNSITEFKSQGSFNGVEIAPFLSAIGQPRWISGRAQGQFALEGSGPNPVEVVRQAQGRSSVTVTDGELIGIALNDALRRVEKRPLLASLNWKGGRTPFNRAQAQVTIRGGVGEVTEGHLTSTALEANLHGQVLLADRSLDLKADISSTGSPSDQSPALEFDVSGGWDSIVVKPDVRSLIERSGAAKPLLPSARSKQKPLATAQ
jgi:AsmA protein